MDKILHYNRIVRGFENRNKNFAPNERIAIDDDGLLYQDGVDENGIPILYLSYDDDGKEKINEIREKIKKPAYQWVGRKTSIGWTKNELIEFASNNDCEIIVDIPDEIYEYKEALRKFRIEWEKKLGKKHIRIGFKDDSDIWDGEKFVENVFAKKENEEKEKEMKSLPRLRLRPRPGTKNNDIN